MQWTLIGLPLSVVSGACLQVNGGRETERRARGASRINPLLQFVATCRTCYAMVARLGACLEFCKPADNQGLTGMATLQQTVGADLSAMRRAGGARFAPQHNNNGVHPLLRPKCLCTPVHPAPSLPYTARLRQCLSHCRKPG